LPSVGNFVLVGLNRNAGEVYDKLLRVGVIVRPMGAWGLPEHIRISSGTEAQLDKALPLLQRVLGGG